MYDHCLPFINTDSIMNGGFEDISPNFNKIWNFITADKISKICVEGDFFPYVYILESIFKLAFLDLTLGGQETYWYIIIVMDP